MLEFTDVEFVGDDRFITVVVDTTAENPLEDVSGADPGKWSARFGGQVYPAVEMGMVDFDRFEIHFYGPTPQAGADQVSYSNAPSDISDSLGRQLAAFTMPL